MVWPDAVAYLMSATSSSKAGHVLFVSLQICLDPKWLPNRMQDCRFLAAKFIVHGNSDQVAFADTINLFLLIVRLFAQSASESG